MEKFLNFTKKPNNENKKEVKPDVIIEDNTNKIPFVEKYRPKCLDDIVYQVNIINTLKSSKLTGKLQHLLFYGPPGTGKTSTILAVLLLL